MCKGVMPVAPASFTPTPCWISARMISTCPKHTAQSIADLSSSPKRRERSALAETRASTAAREPHSAARWRGVRPSSSSTSTPAFWSRSSARMLSWPWLVAIWRGVSPLSSGSFGDAPSLSSSATTALWPFLTAKCTASPLAPAWVSFTTRSMSPSATACSNGVRSHSAHCCIEVVSKMRSKMAASEPLRMVRRFCPPPAI
ncbi:unnamed protein product [Ectocarpus sp. 12 AP-2014]